MVGAGVAGLSAAAALAEKGLAVVVVEAQARAGGRILTQRQPGWPCPVELGAEFVHARAPFFAAALARAHVVAKPHAGAHVMAKGGHLGSGGRAWQEAFALLERLPSNDVSYSDALALPSVRRQAGAEVVALARAYVEGFNAADATRISALGLVLQSRADRAYLAGRIDRVIGGYDRLIDWLVRRLFSAGGRLELRTRADRIDWRGSPITVDCGQGLANMPAAWRAPRVVVTVPVSLLKPGAGLRFSPSLPAAKRDAIARIAVGSVSKLVLRLRAQVWQGMQSRLSRATRARQPVGFLHTPSGIVPTWWAVRPLDVPVLVGWTAGPSALRFAQGHRGDVARATRLGIASLAAAMASDARRLLAAVEDALLVDWASDGFARGAYSWLPVGAVDAPAHLAEPVDGRLFFAGEACHVGYQMGTVHGAMETGLRAAAEVTAGRIGGRSRAGA